jgi:oligoribonuclease NrnB/cAMP/cGMP phosphodiesterase (DHH superfamily)
MFNKKLVDVLIYHDPCSDGLSSAACLHSYSIINKLSQKIEYIGSAYERNSESDKITKLLERVKNKNVIMCDVSFNYDVILKFIEVTSSFLIIDHHKTAKEKLEHLDSKYKIFDMDKCGARLMWEYLFESDKTPLLIDYVQDRDLWLEKMTYGKEFAAWFYNLPLNMEVYYEYMQDDKKLMDGIMTKGIYYKQINDIHIERSSYTDPTFCLIGNRYYFVGYSNTKILKSDVANMLLIKYPLLDFSVAYSINDTGTCTYASLRSHDDATDVSLIAEKMDGGGHRNASGVELMGFRSKLSCTRMNLSHLYSALTQAKFSLTNKFNVIYIPYNYNHKALARYIMGPRDTKDGYIKQQAQYIYKINNKLTTNTLPIFDMCVSVKNEYCNINEIENTAFFVEFNPDINKEKKREFLDATNCICSIILAKGNVKVISGI